jgi:hypothetical protein
MYVEMRVTAVVNAPLAWLRDVGCAHAALARSYRTPCDGRVRVRAEHVAARGCGAL